MIGRMFSVIQINMPRAVMLNLAVFSCLISFSQANVSIEGKCRNGEHVTVMAYTITDYVSMLPVELSRTVAEKGHYKLEFDQTTTRQIFLQVGNSEGSMIVEPGKDYHVDIPVILTNDQVTFDKTVVELVFRDLPPTDINYGFRKFDSDYRTFIEDHYYDFAVGEFKGSETFKSGLGAKNSSTDMYRSSDQPKGFSDQKMPLGDFNNWVELFELYVDSNYTAYLEHPFFRDHKNYRIAELELISGVRPWIIYEENFFSKKIQYTHPSYFSLFRILYANLFEKKNDKDSKDWIKMSINSDKSVQSLEFVFKNDSLFFNEDIRTLAMILNVRDAYYKTDYSKVSIETLLENIATKDRRSEIAGVASNMRKVLKSGKQGWNIESFKLVDSKKEIWNFDEHKGGYTYFIFFTTWSASSQKELLVLEKLTESYKEHIQFVAVCMDDSFDDFEKYVKNHPKQDFKFLFGNADPQLKRIFNVRSIPTVVMLDPESKVMFDYTRRPSEGVQQEFDSIKARSAKKTNVGPKTWKD
jgi:thiol-disulfide isomerase/thioredoxin